MFMNSTPGSGTEGVIINDFTKTEDTIAVLYDNGEAPPVITIDTDSTGVQTVLADGVPVAVLAGADAAVEVSDIVLLEREPKTTLPT